MNYRTYPDNAWLAFRRIYWTLAGAMAVVLVLLAVLGFGPGGRNCQVVAATAGVDDAAAFVVAQGPAKGLSCGMGGSALRPSA